MEAQPSATLAQGQLLKDLNCPVVFKGMIEDWPCRRWTLQEWAQQFGEKKIRFRIGPIQQTAGNVDPLWETDCRYIESTLEEFDHWQNGQLSGSESSEVNSNEMSFSNIKPNDYFAYADYKHMLKLFEIDDNIHNTLDWGKFGFHNRKGQDSTIWIGSPHCHTPCHYDTYGCNLVAQLIGKKRWILYPPSETNCLYPTRIPYEESSVFSAVNIDGPNLAKFPKFANTSPYVITLEEGDVLFVPHKWWHFVKAMTTSVSINSWIPMDIDDERRLEEAVTRTVLSSYVSAHVTDEDLQWLNPTEECTSPEVNIHYVKEALKLCLAGQQNHTDTSEDWHLHGSIMKDDEELNIACAPSEENRENTSVKRASEKLLISAKRPRTKLKAELYGIFSKFATQINMLKPMQYTDFIKEILLDRNSPDLLSKNNLNQNLNEGKEDKFKIDLLNALVDPEVVSLICKKLKGIYL